MWNTCCIPLNPILHKKHQLRICADILWEIKMSSPIASSSQSLLVLVTFTSAESMYSSSFFSIKHHVWKEEQNVPFSSAAQPTANLCGVIKFTESRPRCTPLCAFSKQGQHSLFRQCSHAVFTIDCVAFMSIVHTLFWLISPTDAFKEIDYFLCRPPIFRFSFFSETSCLHPHYQNVFHVYALIKTLWIGTFGQGEVQRSLFVPLYRLTPVQEAEVWGLIPAGSVDTGTDHTHTRLLDFSEGRWFEGGGWGRMGWRNSCPVTWAPTHSPLLLAAHIPQ